MKCIVPTHETVIWSIRYQTFKISAGSAQLIKKEIHEENVDILEVQQELIEEEEEKNGAFFVNMAHLRKCM